MADLCIARIQCIIAKLFENMNHLILPLAARGKTVTSKPEIAEI